MQEICDSLGPVVLLNVFISNSEQNVLKFYFAYFIKRLLLL